jgi:hypothetical protein
MYYVLLPVPNLIPSPLRHTPLPHTFIPYSKGLTHITLFYTLGGRTKPPSCIYIYSIGALMSAVWAVEGVTTLQKHREPLVEQHNVTCQKAQSSAAHVAGITLSCSPDYWLPDVTCDQLSWSSSVFTHIITAWVVDGRMNLEQFTDFKETQYKSWFKLLKPREKAF